MFIDPTRSTLVTDLVSSYKEIRNARQKLLNKWRFALLRAYTKRREKHEQTLAAQRDRATRLKRFQWPVWLGLPVLCIAGYILAFTVDFCDGILLMFGAGIGILIAWNLWQPGFRPPKPPAHPLAQRSREKYTSPLKQRLLPCDLLPRWRSEMSDPIPSEAKVIRMTDENRQYGLIGEYNLVRGLIGVVSPETIILHSVMPKARDDLDVVVVGPKGIWYFEVKYYNAHIKCQDGNWTIGKLNPATGEVKIEHLKESPDKQWYRMRDEIRYNLHANGHKLLSALPGIEKIKGGIVFTHPNATFTIQKSPPFAWGKTHAWLNAYEQAPRVPGMSPLVILRLAELFLEKHRAVNPSQQVFSMKVAVEQILQSVEDDIQKWIASS